MSDVKNRGVVKRAGGGPGEVWLRAHSHKRNYYISRTIGEPAARIDDEAQLEISSTIEAISAPHARHLAQTMQVNLLSAQRYPSNGDATSVFFGSISLRPSQRSALAYLPEQPFWELPGLIAGGATWLCLGWSSMHRGYADLMSLFVGDQADLEQFSADLVGLEAT